MPQKQQHQSFNLIFIAITVIAVILMVLNLVFKINILDLIKDLYMLKFLPSLNNNVSLGLLFIFGLLTSFHCIGMCGGIAISQTLASDNAELESSGSKVKKVILPSALYNTGRIISYTIIGGIVGGLGMVINLTGVWKSIIPIIGGFFMIIMAINLLDIFPLLRYLNVKMPKFIARKVYSRISDSKNKNHFYNPLIVGLLTGLMPCGPLQIIQLYALGTRSILYGAVSMFVFTLGTLPLLFTFGAVSALINKNRSKIILRASAVFVFILGFIMIGRGLALSGISLPFPDTSASSRLNSISYSELKNGYQEVTSDIGSDSFPSITVQKGIPVKWYLNAAKENLNDCNNAIHIAKFHLDKGLETGKNLIEFTPPDNTVVIPYTCWMGMIKSTITVVNDIDSERLKAGLLKSGKDSEAVNSGLSENSLKKDVPSTSCQVMQPSSGITPQPKQEIIKGDSSYSSIDKTPVPTPQKENPADPPGNPGALSGWLKERLTPGSRPNTGNKKIESWTGWLIDRDCIGVNPLKHTKDCNLMGIEDSPPSSCYGSGLGLLVFIPGKSFTSYSSLDGYLTFDAESKNVAAVFLKALPEDWNNNVTIKVSGYRTGKIPVNKDESHVSETVPDNIDHYIEGIHITSIETAFIDGVSTHKLPSPNIILAK